MEENIDVDEIMRNLGFTKERDALGEGYEKEIVVCNSNCIGCEYHMSFGIKKTNNGYNSVGILYKPIAHDSERTNGRNPDEPSSRIFILNTDRGDLENAVYDCASTMMQVMVAMDFRQISGTDFIDLSDSSRSRMRRDFEKASYHNIYVPFNPHCVPGC